MASLEQGRVPSSRPVAARELPLVDRVEEMDALREAVYRAVHGEGGLVFIHGEAGIGKTRLVRELGAYARSRGVQVLYGRCPALFRMDGVPPYILWKEVIKDYLGECTPEQLNRVIGFYPAEVAKLVPELSQKLRPFPESFPISPEQEQNRLFEAVSQFMINISQEIPLLIVLDDLQWVDPSSLLLMHYLARGVQRTSLLLLGAYRSTDIDEKHPLIPVLAELNRERLPQEIQLKRMSLSDVSEMIRNILEQDDVPEEFCKLGYDKTMGNPFFVEEVVKSLKEEEDIYLEDGRWKFKEISTIEFPKSVKNVLKTRFGRLDDECQNVLTLASFVGNDFTLEAMCAVTGIKKRKLIELIDRIFKTGLIKERVIRGEGTCSFADVLVRDVVYEEVSPLKRRELHGIVGSALEKVYAETIDEHYGELASHFFESGDKEKALSYFLKAGDRATRIYAYSEAASYLQSALGLLEAKEGEYREKAHVLEMLGDIKNIAGEYDVCMKRWNEALLLRKQLDEKEKIAGLHRKMGKTLWRDVGKTEQARENFEEALRILESEPESLELATIYADRATMSHFTEDRTKARSWAEKALELAKKLNASEVIASSYVDLGVGFGETEKEKAIESMEKALKIALDNGYLDIALRSYNNIALLLPAEEYERRIECFEKGLELAKKAGLIRFIAWYSGSLSTFHFFMGNSDKALTLMEEADALNRKTGSLFNLSISTLGLGRYYYVLGEWNKSERHLEEALNISLKTNQTQRISQSYGTLGFMYYDKGEYVQAKEYFEKMFETDEKAKSRVYTINMYHWPAMNYIELGEIDKAITLLDDLRKFAHERKDKQLIASEDATRAMLLRAERKYDESIELFEKSLREHEALRARQWNIYWLAKLVLYEYARVYLVRNEEGDGEKARDLLNQALEIYQKIGAKPDIEKVEARIAFIETGRIISKPKSVDYVTTGYADLDRLLGGGLRSGSIITLTSPSCKERNSLIKAFLETGTKKGEITLYVTTDPGSAKSLAEEFQSNFFLTVCNAQADAIIKDLPNVSKLKGVENLTEIGISLTSAINKLDSSLKGPRRICIDLISDILLQHHAVQTRRCLSSLIPELRSEGFTMLAVMDPEMHPPREARAVLDLFEGQIDIYEKETEKGARKYLMIKKMSNQKYLEDELPLKKEQL